jgi:hypothetical protein
MNRFKFLALTVVFCMGLAGCLENPKEEKPVTVGVYYFGGWAGKNAYADNPNEPWAKDAPTHLTRRLATEFAHREPLWGWRDDTPEIMERQIDLAADNGVDFFLFCWYWHDNRRAINKEAIENTSLHTGMDLYMKARNKEKLKYCLLVANHGGAEILGDKNWEDAVTCWMKYFKDPQYITVDNKPLVVLFDVDSITDNQFAMMQEIARKGGLKNGLAIAGCYEKARKRAGCTHSTNYNGAVGDTKGTEAHPYQELIDDAKQQWVGTEEQPHIPLVNAGVDYRPWEGPPPEGTGGPSSWYFPDNTPDLFKSFLADAVRWMDNNPTKATKERIILVYAWNELGEGGYLVPTKGDPDAGKLKKIKEL